MPKAIDPQQQLARQLDHISKPSQSNKNLTPYRQKGTIEYMYGYHQAHRRPKYHANNMIPRDRAELLQPLSNSHVRKPNQGDRNHGNHVSLPRIHRSNSPRGHSDLAHTNNTDNLMQKIELMRKENPSTLSQKYGYLQSTPEQQLPQAV